MKPRLIDGSFFPGANASFAKELPNKDADSQWERLGEARIFPISRADVIRLGKNPSTALKLEDKIWGLGDDAYAATLDVYHQIHCLNSLRQSIYGTYYHRPTANANGPLDDMYEIHLNHCIDLLLQTLQCGGNVNLITLHWYEAQPYPTPDYSINRQCVAFDQLTEWNGKHTIDQDTYGKLHGPKVKDQPEEKASPAMKAWAKKHPVARPV